EVSALRSGPRKSEHNKAVRKRSLSYSCRKPWAWAFGRSSLGAAFCFVERSYSI
ncbi:hypothetical protein HMPREF9104_03224, partial [Lentilactobacillus kisonensis F0435]